MDSEIMMALAVTAELTGTTMSDAAAKVMAQDLARQNTENVILFYIGLVNQIKIS